MYDTVDEMLDAAHEAKKAGADVVEVRLDTLADLDVEDDIPRLIAESPLPVLVTLRPTWEGGYCELPEPARLAALRFAARLGAPYVDVEFLAAKRFFKEYGDEGSSRTRFVISSHNFETTPPLAELEDHIARCEDLIAAHSAPHRPRPVIKLVVTARDASDALCVLGLVRRTVARGQPMIGLAMRETGTPSRVLAGVAGGYLTFATLAGGRASAPGQPPIADVLSRYRLKQQRPGKTLVWGVVGDPVAHSKSPAIHNAALQAAGVDGVYVPFHVTDFPRFLDTIRESGLDVRGLSVTIPHKGAALHAADVADAATTAIGASNTLVWSPDRGTMTAYNTDARAAIEAIERGVVERQAAGGAASRGTTAPLAGKRVVVLGAGGAGRAVAVAAVLAGADVVVANRTVAKAEDVANAARAAAPGRTVAAVSLDAVRDGAVPGDVLANTTQIGMHPDVENSPVPANVLDKYSVVFDAVYTPLHTRLLRDAQARGCGVVTGDRMFLGQAVEQARLFMGREPDVRAMEDALEKASTQAGA